MKIKEGEKVSNGDGKFDQGRYVTIPETKNIKLPIGGKIRLGVKVVNEKGVTHPVELPYFVCPPAVKDVFGDEPTELIVFFPSKEIEEVFPQAYEKYGSNNALLCWGDGEVSKTAQRLNLENGRWEDVVCPCEHFKKWDPKTKTGGCDKTGHLRFMIPEVSIGTFFECTTHGTVSISEINSAFKVADVTTGGCWAMIPFRMRRVAKKLKIPGTAKMKTHWIITLEVAATTEEIRMVKAGKILYLGQQKNAKYQIEAPGLPEENRQYPRVETDEEEKAREEKAKEAQIAEETYYKESKKREEQLKKDRAVGKTGIRTPEEAKAITKKKAKFRVDLKEEIEKLSKKHDFKSWTELIELGQRRKIFHKGIATWHTAMDWLTANPEDCKKFKEFIKTDQEVSDEDIPF